MTFQSNRRLKTVLALAFLLSAAACLTSASASSAADLQTWSQLRPAHSPLGDSRGGLATDPLTGGLIYFGGPGNNETWLWDGGGWTELTPENSPTTSGKVMVTFDQVNDEVVLFGAGTSRDETWTWDGNDWTEQSPVDSPPGRSAATLTFDPGSGETVLFGGEGSGGFLDDTWIWDGSTWTEAHPQNTPPARSSASMTVNADNDEILLFGGRSETENCFRDTWTWDGTDWSEHEPAVSPTCRFNASMSYVPSIDEVMLFGGRVGTVDLAGTWLWDGSTWVQVVPPKSPYRRANAAMGPDAEGNVLMFGGESYEQSSETWTYGLVDRLQTVPVLTPMDATSATIGDPIQVSVDVSEIWQPTGHLTFNAYSPYDSNCFDEPVYSSPQIQINGDGEYVSPWYTPPFTGKYYWRIFYSGDRYNDPVGSDCSAPGSVSNVSDPAPACPPVDYLFTISSFKPNRVALNRQVPGIRVRFDSDRDVDAYIAPRFEYRADGRQFTTYLNKRTVRINRVRRALFGIPAGMANRLRKSTGRVSRNRVTFRVDATLRARGAEPGCDQIRSDSMNVRISGVSTKTALRRR